MLNSIGLVNNLREAEVAFEKIYLQKVEDESSRNSIDLKLLTAPIRRNLNELFTMLESLERLHPETYSPIV